jgi:hypothetical protein
MEFGNPVVGGVTLVRTDIESQGFVTGSTGWRISRAGDAEFNDVTIRGDLSLSAIYAPVLSIYDGSGGGVPAWNIASQYVLFSSASWGAVDAVAPTSGRIRWDLQLKGMNNNTAASTLSVDMECLESSGTGYPTNPGFVGPGTTLHTPNVSDAAYVSSQVAGNTAQVQTSSWFVMDGLTPNQWYRFRPYWRISSGSAVNITFDNQSSKYLISPVV